MLEVVTLHNSRYFLLLVLACIFRVRTQKYNNNIKSQTFFMFHKISKAFCITGHYDLQSRWTLGVAKCCCHARWTNQRWLLPVRQVYDHSSIK
jgi:hypothetical protein